MADLELEPGEIAFIDDKQANVDGALAVGWHAHLWVSDADTRAWLETLGVLRPRACRVRGTRTGDTTKPRAWARGFA